jgi:hypothetical protein
MNNLSEELNILIKNHLDYLNESLVAGENVQEGDFIVKSSDKSKLTGDFKKDYNLFYKVTDFTETGNSLIISLDQLDKWRNSNNVDRTLMSKEINLKDYDVIDVENDYADFPKTLLDEGKVKSSRTKSGKKVPGKYLTRDKAAMKGEIERVSKLKADDPSAYGKWEADYKARNTKDGKPHKTKKSAATIAYEKKFGKKNEQMENLNEDFINEDVDKALSNKAKASGISASILRQVYSRGAAAWKSGHRPGVSQQQWAAGRLNSFITGKGGARKADADLWAKAKKSKKRKNESTEEQLLRNKIREILYEELNKDLEELYPMLVGEDDLEELYPMLVGEDNLEEGLGKYLAGAALAASLVGAPMKSSAQTPIKDFAKEKIAMVQDKVGSLFNKKTTADLSQKGGGAEASIDSLNKMVGKIEKIGDNRFQTVGTATSDNLDMALDLARSNGMNSIADGVKGKEISPGKRIYSARLTNTQTKDQRVFQNEDGSYTCFITVASFVN